MWKCLSLVAIGKLCIEGSGCKQEGRRHNLKPCFIVTLSPSKVPSTTSTTMSIPHHAFRRIIRQASLATRTATKPRTVQNVVPQATRHITTSCLQPWRAHHLPITLHDGAQRSASTAQPPPQPLPHRPAPHRNPDEPCYELTFTCKACRHRSAHTVSKQGYHKGTTLITCPGCKARHLISDHLHVSPSDRNRQDCD